MPAHRQQRVVAVRAAGAACGAVRPADGGEQRLVGPGAHVGAGLDAGGRPVLVGPLQRFDPAVHRGQQPVLLVHHALPHGALDEQVARRLRAVGGPVLHAARLDLHPQDVVVGHGLLPGRAALERRLEEHPETAAHPETEGVLELRGRSPAVGILIGGRVRLVRYVQLPQRDPAQHAVLRGAARQGVPGALDRAEEQRARFEPAEEVPVALFRRVDGEQVQGTAHDEPHHLRPFQVQAAQAGGVDGRAETAERVEHRVGLLVGLVEGGGRRGYG
jgi:hypothetical protein